MSIAAKETITRYPQVHPFLTNRKNLQLISPPSHPPPHHTLAAPNLQDTTCVASTLNIDTCDDDSGNIALDVLWTFLLTSLSDKDKTAPESARLLTSALATTIPETLVLMCPSPSTLRFR